MSKPSLSSLHTQITELTAQVAEIPLLKSQIAALLARLDASTAPAPVAEKKRAKNPDAPKRAPGPYILFLQAERAKTPELKLLVTELAERWNALTPEQKQAYKSAPAVAAPAEAKTTFQEVHDVALTMSSTVAGKFLRFCVQNPTLDAKTAEARWKSLSPEEKAKFNDPGDDTDEDDDSSDDEE
jgi:hypothetical protein